VRVNAITVLGALAAVASVEVAAGRLVVSRMALGTAVAAVGLVAMTVRALDVQRDGPGRQVGG
jgi:hypothetical protein